MTNDVPASLRPRAWEICLLIALSAPILFYGLGSYSVVNGDEAFYHYVARQMVQSGDWLRLEFTGEHRIYDTMMNAPVQYWLRAGLILLFGDNPWTMRGLSALSAMASLLMTFLLGRRLGGRSAGWIAALIQLTSYQFVYLHSARTGELEPLLCFVFTLIAWLFLDGIEGRRGFVPHHLAWMLLANIKMPLFAIPLLAEGFYFLLSRDSRGVLGSYLRSATLLPLGFVWHLAHLLTMGPEVREAVAQMTGEASGSGLLKQRDFLANIRFHIGNLFSGAFPWSLLFLPGALGLWLSEPTARLKKALPVVYPLAILVFFSLVAKSHPWYVVPMYPFLAVATAVGWSAFVRIQGRATTLAIGVLVALALWLEYADPSPFARRAVEQLADPPSWRAFESLAPWALPATVVVLIGVLLWVRRAIGPRAVALGVIAIMLVSAGWRVLLPLRWVEHRSQMEQQRMIIDAMRLGGESLPLPIPIREPGAQMVRYYFADDFVIVRSSDSRAFYWLVREGRTLGDPKTLRR
jgi:4-amino-4-deoxy-L-arabinose transferase-like glycosyltransferase